MARRSRRLAALDVATRNVPRVAGRSRQAVARVCGVSERTVYRWQAVAASSTGRAS
jgi:hypothetical protein